MLLQWQWRSAVIRALARSLDSLIESVSSGFMKLVVQIQLIPDTESARKLRESVERFNEAANWLAGVAFDQQISNKIGLQKIAYREVRERFGLSSQMACLCIHRVCEAYRRDKSKRPKFRSHSAMSHDIRTMSFKGIDRVSLLTLEGRVIVPFLLGSYQAERLPQRKGQCDLVLRKDGKWFLIVTIDVPEGSPVPVTDFLGVDMGIARIATTSDNAEGIAASRSNESAASTTSSESASNAREPEEPRRNSCGYPARRPGSAVMKTIAPARRSSSPPGAPAAGLPSRTSKASGD